MPSKPYEVLRTKTSVLCDSFSLGEYWQTDIVLQDIYYDILNSRTELLQSKNNFATVFGGATYKKYQIRNHYR